MIARLWRGQTDTAQGDRYLSHVTERVLPKLQGIPGHRGAFVLRRPLEDRTEFLVMTLWDSLDAVRAFAGNDLEAAVVEPDAKAVLVEFDTFVQHYDVTHSLDRQ
jgi:heme-degrading monooxygenase HmoA